jgi:uncharacterized protein (TIRG00374 family)
MMLERKTLLKKTIPFILIGLLAFALYLIFFVNINEMIENIRQTNITIFLVSVAVSIFEMAFFALAWHYYLKPLSATVSFKKAFAYSYASVFIDLLIPAESVSGEIAKIYFVTQDGVDAGKAVASIVAQRIFGTLITFGALVIGALQLSIWSIPSLSLIQSLILLVVVSTIILLSLFLILCLKENWTQKAIAKIITFVERISHGRWNLDGWRNEIRKSISAFYESLRTFRANPEKLILPIGFSMLSWFLGISIYYLVFAAMGHTLDWATLVIVYCLIIALKSIPIGVPAEVGVTEIAMTVLFGALLGPAWLPISAAATVLIRIVTVWFRFIIGFGAIQWIGIKTIMGKEVSAQQKALM